MLLYLALSVLVLGTSLVSPHQHGQKTHGNEDLRSVSQRLDALQKQINKVERAFITIHKARTFGRGTEKIYSTNEQESTYAPANATCLLNFGCIPSPRSDEENRALQNVLKRHNKAAYIDRNPSGYSNWAAGQQNVAENKNCVKMNTDGKWSSASCQERLLVVCEFSFNLNP